MNYTFFNRPKPKQFEYKPRFYDPENDTEAPKEKLSETEEFAKRLHRSWNSKRTQKEKKGFSSSAMIWIVAILAILVYFILRFK